MSTETRDFHIGDILSVTTGRLVAPRHVDALYDILNFMTGDNLFTHQLPRGMDECAPSLREQHPDLGAVEAPEFADEAAVWEWLAQQVDRFGATRQVAALSHDEHTRMDPLTELRKMAPHAEVITVTVPGGEGDR